MGHEYQHGGGQVQQKRWQGPESTYDLRQSLGRLGQVGTIPRGLTSSSPADGQQQACRRTHHTAEPYLLSSGSARPAIYGSVAKAWGACKGCPSVLLAGGHAAAGTHHTAEPHGLQASHGSQVAD